MSRGILCGRILERGDFVQVDFVLGGYCPGGYSAGVYCPRTNTEHMAHVRKFYTSAQTFIYGIITASAKHFLYLLVKIHVFTEFLINFFTVRSIVYILKAFIYSLFG